MRRRLRSKFIGAAGDAGGSAQKVTMMREVQAQRKRLLSALLNHAKESGNFNPHFYKKEMRDILGVPEDEFNIIQKNLGEKYCHYVDYSTSAGERYAINVSECLALQEQYDQEIINDNRHRQLVRLVILVAILGAVLGVALSLWFSQ